MIETTRKRYYPIGRIDGLVQDTLLATDDSFNFRRVGARFDLESGLMEMQTEWVAGVSLRSIFDLGIEHRPDIFEFRRILELVRGLHSTKFSLLHGDISPANIIRSIEKGSVDYQLIDWCELSSEYYERIRLPRRKFRGKPSYLSPERARTGKNSIQSEVYALGAILNEWVNDNLTVTNDQRGFQELLVREENFQINVSGKFAPSILGSMAINPKGRFQSIGDFIKVFERDSLEGCE